MTAPAQLDVCADRERYEPAVEMVLRHLREARLKKSTGKLTLEFELFKGGVVKKWASTRYEE